MTRPAATGGRAAGDIHPESALASNVAIVMATWNGASHVEEQVASLRAQDVSGWRLLARDDGSTDGTAALVARLAAGDPRVAVLPGGERLGAIGNFARLLEHALRSGADRVFPCDQDDVWRPDKLSRALALMARLEAEHGRDTPLLVHSDLEVVDEALRPLHPSFLRFQGVAHEERSPLRVLLVQNFVTGCASLANRALLDLALPFPPHVIMHDWWLALCAAARGRIGLVPGTTVRYRQHGGNQLGAGGARGSLNPFDGEARQRFARSWRATQQALAQAGDLEARLRERGGAAPDVLDLVSAFARLDREPPGRRLRTLRRLGVRCHRPLGTAFLYARLGLVPRRPAPPPAPRAP